MTVHIACVFKPYATKSIYFICVNETTNYILKSWIEFTSTSKTHCFIFHWRRISRAQCQFHLKGWDGFDAACNEWEGAKCVLRRMPFFVIGGENLAVLRFPSWIKESSDQEPIRARDNPLRRAPKLSLKHPTSMQTLSSKTTRAFRKTLQRIKLPLRTWELRDTLLPLSVHTQCTFFSAVLFRSCSPLCYIRSKCVLRFWGLSFSEIRPFGWV